MVFQVVMLLVLVAFAAIGVSGYRRNWIPRRTGLLWLALCFGAALTVLWPNWTTKFARMLGIGRGVDLIFYCGLLAAMVGFWMVYLRLCAIRRQLTLLVRHLAISEAQRELSGTNAVHTADPPDPSQ